MTKSILQLLGRQRINLSLKLIQIQLLVYLLLFSELQDQMYQFPSRSRQHNRNYDQTLLNGRRSYNFQNMKASTQISQTDKRIEQIKRKYDTPNRKERLSQLSSKKGDINLNKQNQNYGTADFKSKSIICLNTQTQGNENSLKQSKNMLNYESKGILRNSRQKVYNNQNSNTKSSLIDKISKQSDNYDTRKGLNKLYKNQNQEQFFKRVKQMKQSLLCNENTNKPLLDSYNSKNYNQNINYKQSIQYTSKNNEMKVSGYAQSKQSRNRQAMYDTTNNVQKDRIDNIDKINQKIKGILECLNMNQKSRNGSKYNPDLDKKNRFQNLDKNNNQVQNRQSLKTPMKGSLNLGRQTFGVLHRHQKSDLLEKIQINNIHSKPSNQQDDKWEKLSNKLQKYEFQTKNRLQRAFDNSKQLEDQTFSNKFHERNNNSYFEQPVPNSKPNQILRRDNKSVDFRDLKSRSFIHSTNIRQIRDRSVNIRETHTPKQVKQYQMRSGKKLDDQIGRIQKKIQQFQEQKKRLNIQFKPFAYSNCKSSSNLFTNQRYDVSEKKISQFTRNLYKQQKNEGLKQYQKNQNQSTFREKKQPERNSQAHQFQRKLYENRFQSKIQIKLQKSNPSSVRTSKFMSQNSSRISGNQEQESYTLQKQSKQHIRQQNKKQFNYFFDDSLKKQTDQGIQDRKKKLMSSQNQSSKNNNELKILVQTLCSQVRLDEEFRNAKIWYQYYDHPQKQEQIRKLLPQKSLQQIKQLLKVRESENNPFFTAQGFDSSIQKIVQLYKLSQDHWRQKIYKRFDQSSLKEQGFTNKEIDLQKKGYISLGDLVRFLNLQSGTFYRNRDLSLIFIRVCKQNKSSCYTELSFEWLIQAFSK